MTFEAPSTPVHSLQLLKENMRTEIIFYLHERIRAGMNASEKKPPLFNIIESIGDILDVFSDTRFLKCVGRNPYNTKHITIPSRFDSEREADTTSSSSRFISNFCKKSGGNSKSPGIGILVRNRICIVLLPPYPQLPSRSPTNRSVSPNALTPTEPRPSRKRAFRPGVRTIPRLHERLHGRFQTPARHLFP